MPNPLIQPLVPCDCCGEFITKDPGLSHFSHGSPTHPSHDSWNLCASCAQSVSDHLTELCYEEADEDEDSNDDFGFDPSYPLADDYDGDLEDFSDLED